MFLGMTRTYPAGALVRFIQMSCTMKIRQCVCAAILAAGFLGILAVSDVSAFGRRRSAYYSAPVGEYYAEPYYAVPAYPYSPYVMPLPAYGILPPPLATYEMLYNRGYLADPQGTRVADGAVRDPSEAPPRKRPSVYPAVPFGASPEVQLSDLRRVRYEITVPFENAIVLLDGVKTKQTGLKRVFVTPPLDEEKQYTVTITVQWADESGETRIRRKDFTVVAGETVRHTFIE
jgi:uncharacterized protein (TIGR03000 family)